MLAVRVAFRYRLALNIRQNLQDYQRARKLIEDALRKDDLPLAQKLFVGLGQRLDPLATLLKDVTIQRSDEKRKLKNVKQWLHQLSYPFDPKNLSSDPTELGYWISHTLDTVGESLKSLARVQARLEGYTSIERSFQHGPYTIINKYGYTPAEYETPLSVLDSASDACKKVGFGSVVYGEVSLVTTRQVGGSYAGMYSQKTDSILLNVEARNRFDGVYTLVHELGHRYWHKKLSSAQREAYEESYAAGAGALSLEDREDMFQALVKANFGPRKAARFLNNPSLATTLLDYFKDNYSGTGSSGKDLAQAHARGEQWVYRNFVRPKRRYVIMANKPPVTVTEYATTNVGEDYAETFAHFVLKKTIPPEVMERFELAK
jgi:hypothetical protein